MKNCFTSDENTLSKKKNISCPTTSQSNCSVNRMICSRFLSDYLEIFSAAPRKSLDNHSKTSHRSSCFPHSFVEVVENKKYYKGLWRNLIFFPYWMAEKATRIVFLLVCGRELVFSTTHILIRVASQPSSMEQKIKVHRRPL